MVLVEDVTDSAGRTSSGANTSSTPHQSTQSEVMVMNFYFFFQVLTRI